MSVHQRVKGILHDAEQAILQAVQHAENELLFDINHALLSRPYNKPYPSSTHFSKYGYGGDWSSQPLGEILDANQNGDKWQITCRKYNCHCELKHPNEL